MHIKSQVIRPTYKLSFEMFVCLSVCLFICLFVCLFVCLFACLFVCWGVCLLVCWGVCLFVCLLACLFASQNISCGNALGNHNMMGLVLCIVLTIQSTIILWRISLSVHMQMLTIQSIHYVIIMQSIIQLK